MSNSGSIRITARTLDLAREALADWRAENPNRVLDRVTAPSARQRLAAMVAGPGGLPLAYDSNALRRISGKLRPVARQCVTPRGGNRL